MYAASSKLQNDVFFLPQVVHWILPIKDDGTKPKNPYNHGLSHSSVVSTCHNQLVELQRS
jgi:hypothetical protein